MAKYKNQHFLARSYLKGFSAGEINGKPVIWVADLEKKIIKIRSIEKTASRSYLYSFLNENGKYDHRIELAFSKLEQLYPDLIRRIKPSIESYILGKPLSRIIPKDQKVLCEYLYMNMCRIPKSMDWMIEESVGHNERMSQKGFKDTIESRPSNLAVLGLYDIWSKREKAVQNFMGKNTKISFPVRKSSILITCDNPVLQQRDSGGTGIIYDDARIMFPLYSRAFLTLFGLGNELALEKIHDLSMIDRFNKLISANAVKEIYGPTCDSILKSIVNIHNWTIKEQAVSFDEEYRLSHRCLSKCFAKFNKRYVKLTKGISSI